MNRLFADDLYWVQINDGDALAFEIFRRHYTYRKGRKRDLNRNMKNGKRMAGPGETIVLIGSDGKALFIWKKQQYSQDGQTGINCCVFRNERKKEDGPLRSSDLIRQAEQIAWSRWPGERLFTYINAGRIKSINPGCCYKKSGWRWCGISKARKLLIFEKHEYTYSYKKGGIRKIHSHNNKIMQPDESTIKKMEEKASVWNDDIQPHILRGILIGWQMAKKEQPARSKDDPGMRWENRLPDNLSMYQHLRITTDSLQFKGFGAIKLFSSGPKWYDIATQKSYEMSEVEWLDEGAKENIGN